MKSQKKIETKIKPESHIGASQNAKPEKKAFNNLRVIFYNKYIFVCNLKFLNKKCRNQI